MGGLVDDLDKNRWLTAAFFGGPNDLDNGVVGNVNCISKIGMDVGWLFVNAPSRLCSLFKQT